MSGFTTNPWSASGGNNGKEISLTTDGTFRMSYGQNLIVNCTADSDLNPVGNFTTGVGVNIFNTGTHNILLDGSHSVAPGQVGRFAYNGTTDEFVGGV